MQKVHRPVRTSQVIGFLSQRIRPSIEIHENLRLNQARNNGCTNARSIPTRSCGYGDFKNINPGFVQKAYRPVRTRQVIGFLFTAHMAVNRNSRKLTAKPSSEQWSHQCKEHTYKKLRVWGVQKCKPWLCAESAQTGTDPPYNRFPAMAHKAVNGSSRKLTAKPSTKQSLH